MAMLAKLFNEVAGRQCRGEDENISDEASALCRLERIDAPRHSHGVARSAAPLLKQMFCPVSLKRRSRAAYAAWNCRVASSASHLLPAAAMSSARRPRCPGTRIVFSPSWWARPKASLSTDRWVA